MGGKGREGKGEDRQLTCGIAVLQCFGPHHLLDNATVQYTYGTGVSQSCLLQQGGISIRS